MRLKRYFLFTFAALICVSSANFAAKAAQPLSDKTTAAVVEIGLLPIKPEFEKQYRQAYFSTLSVLQRQRGYRSNYWGKKIEGDTLTYVIMVEWDSLQSHERFQKSPDYPAYVGAIKEFLAVDPASLQFFHINAQAFSRDRLSVSDR